MVLLSVVNVWRGRVGLVVRGVRRAQVRMNMTCETHRVMKVLKLGLLLILNGIATF